MSVTEIYTCDRCGATRKGAGSFMSAPAEVRFDHEPVKYEKEYRHICNECSSELCDLVLAAVDEWQGEKNQ